MELAAPPEEYAQAVLSCLNSKPPIDLEAIARALRLDVRDVSAKGFDGAMFPFRDRAGGRVSVNRTNRERGRQRFTLAHEIGHYVLPGKPVAAACTVPSSGLWGQRDTKAERDADLFAVELLIPRNQVQPIVSERGVTLGTVEVIKKTFDVSLTAAACRAVELSDDKCAVVITIDGVVNRYHGSRSWNHRIRTNRPVGRYTMAGRLLANKGLTEVDLVYLSEWMTDVAYEDRSIKLWEESVNQISYSTIVTLITILDDEQ